MDYKNGTREVYDKYAGVFEEYTSNFRQLFFSKQIELFIEILPGKRVLDLGCGPGRDALFFQQKGLLPIGIDYSKVMIDLCKEKGLFAVLMDLEEPGFRDSSFDGVWANASLLHIPKSRLQPTLEKLAQILAPKGVLYIGMREGDTEGWLESEKYPNMKRFFSLYTDEELKERLSQSFQILQSFRLPLWNNAMALNYLCRKK